MQCELGKKYVKFLAKKNQQLLCALTEGTGLTEFTNLFKT